MHALYSCIADQHDLRLVALAAVICVVGVYSTFSLATYAYFSRQPTERVLWAVACVVSSATATWSTHFIAMLAFHPGMPSGFEPVLTVASLAIAIVIIGAGLAGAVFARNTPWRAAGGAVVGLGVSAMHYVGMAAYEVPGEKHWDVATIVASVALSVGFAAAGAVFALHPRKAVRHLAPPAMLLAICALHFVGMSAMTVVYDPAKTLPPAAVSPAILSVLVAASTLFISAMAAAGLVLHRAGKRRRRAERQRLNDLADVALEGLLICDGDIIVSANASVAAVAGEGAPALRGRSVDSLLDGLHAEAISETAEQDATLRREGELIPVRVLRRAITLHGRPHSVIAVRDQRERLRTEARFRDLAFSDALTGLPNRAKFSEVLAAKLASRRKGDEGFAVMMVDLDRFKLVNDTLGHGAGDILLQRAANRLKAAARDGDTVARLGGDEFAVLQSEVNDPQDTLVMAARIVDLMARPFIIDGQVVNIGASVGVALAPSDGDTAEILMRNADLAAYNAKMNGRGAFRLFEASLDARMQARRALEHDLRRAVARHEFELFYQPLVDARTSQMTGAEALIRWRHPERGLVSPTDFIPLAEETGLIANIGQWVLRTACAEAMTWPDHLCVAVNLSPVQFRDPRLAEMVKGVLAQTGLPAERLELEITEGVLIADEARTLEILTELRRCGVRISMDDFGTGYSSLSYLRRFPFDKIKVDQSFIRQVPENAESAAIVRAIITMGACLGLSTTVEGVETAEQLAFTAAEGCDQVQGYLFSRPLTTGDLAVFISGLRKAA